jgi:hypothetical protein
MAFILDHTASGDLTLVGSHSASTGGYSFPKPTGQNHDLILMAACEFGIDAIHNLQSELDTKVNISDVGSAIYKNADNSANNLAVVGNDGLFNESVIPASILNTVFVVSSSSDLTLLSSAKKGDTATTTANNQLCTYILTGTFSNSLDWVPLVNEAIKIQTVNGYSGVVSLSGHDIDLSSGFYSGSSIDEAVADLQANKVSYQCLTGDPVYTTNTYFETLIANYSTSDSYNAALTGCYKTTGDVSSYLEDYTLTCDLDSVHLDDYVPRTETGTVAALNVGSTSGTILEVLGGDVISTNVLNNIAYTDTFTISAESQLTGLSSAEAGDIAIDLTNEKTYILTGQSANAYQNLSEWKEFVDQEGIVYTVNGLSPDGNRDVTFSSSDVYLHSQTGSTITSKIESIESSIGSLESTYKTSGSLTGDRANYTLESTFNDIAATKSVTGHGHAMSDVSGLVACAALMTAFLQGDLVSLNQSYSYKLDPNSANTSTNSLMLGKESKAIVNHEIAHAAGKDSIVGDVQSSQLVGKVQSSGHTWTSLITYPVDSNSLSFIKAEVVGQSFTNTGKFVSLTVEGALARNGSTAEVVGEVAKVIHARTNDHYDVRFIGSSEDVVVQVRANGNDVLNWVGKSTLMKLEVDSSGVSPTIGAYYSGVSGSSYWYDLNNWFTNQALSSQATQLPNASTCVELFGAVAPLVDLDNGSWVQPYSIDSTQIGDAYGICFTSSISGVFSGIVYGDASFFGNSQIA